MENPLEEYGIKFIARDGTVHSWPCDEHRGAIVYPAVDRINNGFILSKPWVISTSYDSGGVRF